MFTTEMFLRLLVALIVGALIGLNRDLHHKTARMRTHAIVTLGAALSTMAVCDLTGNLAVNVEATSHVLQGILTGIGFLGAGVIMRSTDGHVSGLTTAATIWICAIFGALAGSGHWMLVCVSAIMVLLVLMLGGKLERALEHRFSRSIISLSPVAKAPSISKDEE